MATGKIPQFVLLLFELSSVTVHAPVISAVQNFKSKMQASV